MTGNSKENDRCTLTIDLEDFINGQEGNENNSNSNIQERKG